MEVIKKASKVIVFVASSKSLLNRRLNSFQPDIIEGGNKLRGKNGKGESIRLCFFLSTSKLYYY